MMGTVTAIQENSITVKTTTDQSVEITTTAKTAYQRAGKTAAAADFKVGDRVVVEAHEKGGKLEAEGIRFGASTPKGNMLSWSVSAPASDCTITKQQ